MRCITTALVSIILTAGVSVGITHTVMQEQSRQEVDRVTVDAFNDGFLYGACDQDTGTDGLGNLCK